MQRIRDQNVDLQKQQEYRYSELQTMAENLHKQEISNITQHNELINKIREEDARRQEIFHR